MANSRSARKRVRKTRTETARNKQVRTRVKSFRKEVASAIASGDAKAAHEAYDKFASAVDRAANRNIVHKNAASRLKSDLSSRIKAVASA